MRQVKIFNRRNFNDQLIDVESRINGWIEEMSNDPTFRISDMRVNVYNCDFIVTILYEIESKKEKEKRHRIGMEMAKILADPPKEELLCNDYDFIQSAKKGEVKRK